MGVKIGKEGFFCQEMNSFKPIVDMEWDYTLEDTKVIKRRGARGIWASL